MYKNKKKKKVARKKNLKWATSVPLFQSRKIKLYFITISYFFLLKKKIEMYLIILALQNFKLKK